MTAQPIPYNATVCGIRRIHDDLIVLRVSPDDALPDFAAGQYTTLGLRPSEPRIDGVPRSKSDNERLIRRAYSISHPVIEDVGIESDFLEFYIALVHRDSDEPPSLTPRLFGLNVGDRLFMGPRPKGSYTLEAVGPEDDIIFVATGTGEAPHNAMIAELFRTAHRGRIGSFVCVRNKQDLGYRDQHQQLKQQNPDYRYVALTTREPENLDASHPNFVGKKYVQSVFASDELVDLLGWEPRPESTHVFLCGNPSMIGIPKRDDDGQVVFPNPPGMIETLVARGFRLEQARTAGNIHFERYW